MSVFMIVSTLISGAVVGALLGLFGGGGSVLATPLLLYVVGIRDPHVAIGTSAAAVAVNAAINLKNMAVSSTASACGGEGAGLVREPEAKPAPVKQESNGRAGSA